MTTDLELDPPRTVRLGEPFYGRAGDRLDLVAVVEGRELVVGRLELDRELLGRITAGPRRRA